MTTIETADPVLYRTVDGEDERVIVGGPEFGFTAYGVRLSMLGEDGDWIALGHVEPRRMLAAMRKASRDEGMDDIDAYATFAELLDAVDQQRAVFTEVGPEETEFEWWCHYGPRAQEHPCAVDVTVFRP